ncbi:hypothetical protein GGX14DRAFT_511112, partial [Mycena pura]
MHIFDHLIELHSQPSQQYFSPDEVWSRVEIYCKELLRQKRGFPLYVPGPQINLPADYRRCGVGIGDVGRVTSEGIFDFYFNVYHPADHPINANRVPEDFRPLPRYTSDNVLKLEYESGDYVSSPSVFNSEPVTRCTGNTGAVLALPHGARVEKLENLEALRRYAAENAHSWYRYVNGPDRGRGLENGTLCLVTGCEKTSSWGMASFQHGLPQAQEGFQLCFGPTSGADKYRWRGGTPAHHKHVDPPSTEGAPLNQTTFIHAFTISLGEGPWARLFGDIRIHQLAEYPGHSTKPGSGFVPYSSQGWWSFSFFGGGAAAGGRKHADRNNDHENVSMSEAAPTSKIIHPSRIINEHLVRAAPHASVVITHDDDWRDLLSEGGTQNAAQDASDLLRRISETFDVADEEGVLFLARRSEATPPGTAVMPLPPVGRAIGSVSLGGVHSGHDGPGLSGGSCVALTSPPWSSSGPGPNGSLRQHTQPDSKFMAVDSDRAGSAVHQMSFIFSVSAHGSIFAGRSNTKEHIQLHIESESGTSAVEDRDEGTKENADTETTIEYKCGLNAGRPHERGPKDQRMCEQEEKILESEAAGGLTEPDAAVEAESGVPFPASIPAAVVACTNSLPQSSTPDQDRDYIAEVQQRAHTPDNIHISLDPHDPFEYANLGSPPFPDTPSYNGSCPDSPCSNHSELSFDGEQDSFGLIEDEPAGSISVPDYNPSEYDPPQTSLLMFDDREYVNGPYDPNQI